METEEGYTRATKYNEYIGLEDYQHFDKFLTSKIEL